MRCIDQNHRLLVESEDVRVYQNRRLLVESADVRVDQNRRLNDGSVDVEAEVLEEGNTDCDVSLSRVCEQFHIDRLDQLDNCQHNHAVYL